RNLTSMHLFGRGKILTRGGNSGASPGFAKYTPPDYRWHIDCSHTNARDSGESHMKHLRPMLAVAIVMFAMAVPSISAAQYHDERLDRFLNERPQLKEQL